MNAVDYLVFIDACLPDYFQGSSRPYVAIGLSPKMTHKDLRTAVEAAVNDEAFEIVGWEDTQYDELTRMIISRLSKYILARSRDIPEESKYGNCVYAYVGLIIHEMENRLPF